METNWNSHGVLAKGMVESWTLKPASEGGVAMACDGQYLYIHGPFGLCKVGSGYGNTKKVGLSDPLLYQAFTSPIPGPSLHQSHSQVTFPGQDCSIYWGRSPHRIIVAGVKVYSVLVNKVFLNMWH